MLEIYKEIVRLIELGEKAALATVISATGSTPGKESARMLVRADGSTLGTIGGGCTEADVWALAREVIATDRPIRRSFKLTPRAAEEDGLACGGIVEIFVEPLGSPTLYVFGAGHIARSLVPLALGVGLNTVVVDDREQFAERSRFPEPTRLVVSDFSSAFQRLQITENSYLVIVTRGHRHDQCVLAEAIKTRASYVGLIGSRAKILRIFRHLAAQGADPARLQQVKAPIGLDIGCRTPEEIAVSIAAELIAHRRRFYVKGNDPRRLAPADGVSSAGNGEAELAAEEDDPSPPVARRGL
jgi:xanthine dehydrogenase accessory factor